MGRKRFGWFNILFQPPLGGIVIACLIVVMVLAWTLVTGKWSTLDGDHPKQSVPPTSTSTPERSGVTADQNSGK